MADNDALSTLTWLMDAGADEAMGETPINRLVQRAAIPHPPLEGGSKFASEANKFRGEVSGSQAYPSPKNPPAARPNFSTLPQGVGGISATAQTSGDAIGTAMSSASGAQGLADLKAALEAFEGCALKRGATNTVFADGTPTGRVMFIGEAPGRDEDRIGKPFVGRAGQLLDKMLASVGLSRATNCYITNVINWRPPENRDPAPEEAAMCLPFLRRHIELADPAVIVLLGAVAARHVVGITDGIMKSRGRWMEYRLGDHMVPLLLTLHPAYLLRQPAHKKLAWRDLQALAAKMEELQVGPNIPVAGVSRNP